MHITPETAAFSALEQLAKIKQREIVLPILSQKVVTTQLMVGDDIFIRSSLLSPEQYETEITRLVYNHITFTDQNIEKPPFDTFIKTLTHIDRKVIIWSILNSSYDKIAKFDITCPNDQCKNEFKDEITYDQLLHEDSLTIWSEELPSTSFVVSSKQKVEHETIDNIEFELKLPTIQDRINVMRLIGFDKVSSNFEKYRTPFTNNENMTLITKRILINSKDSQKQVLDNQQDIYIAYTKYISDSMSKNVIMDFDKVFGKYAPKFYKPYVCSKCGLEFDFEVDVEATLYQNFLGLEI